MLCRDMRPLLVTPKDAKPDLPYVARAESHFRRLYGPYYIRGHHLLPLSMACRALRSVCAPIMFTSIVISNNTGCPPSSIYIYIQYVQPISATNH